MINNYFNPIEFQVSIKRLPNVEFFVQRTTIPSVNAQAPTTPTPFNPIHHTPDKLAYGVLEMTFIIDKKMENYIEILNWIKGNTFPERYAQFRRQMAQPEGLYSDITVTAYNSHKNPVVTFTYRNCQPVTLTEVMLDTTSPDLIHPQATVIFAYDYFDVETVA
jgi:hypothetical protein